MAGTGSPSKEPRTTMDRDYEQAAPSPSSPPPPSPQPQIVEVANVAMTPFSVIASTCMQVILMNSSSSTPEPAMWFTLITASIVATAGMLMAIFLVTTNNCNPDATPSDVSKASTCSKLLSFAKNIIHDDASYKRPVCDEREQVRIARMMLRCLWFSLSYMVTGLLGEFLRSQVKVGNAGSIIGVVLSVWFIFVWSSFGAPLPKFYPGLKVLGRLFTTAFPLILMAAYTALYFTKEYPKM